VTEKRKNEKRVKEIVDTIQTIVLVWPYKLNLEDI
jgi:hypothetical protein